MKIRLRDIKLNQLNNKSLTLVSKYARLLKVKEGIHLKLQEPDILIKISDSARKTKDDDLIELYQEIKDEVRIGVYESLKG